VDRRAVSRAEGYLDVYDHHVADREAPVLAQGVQLSEAELCRCHESGTALRHCPTSEPVPRLRPVPHRRREGSRAVRCRSGSAPISAAAPSFSLLATMGAAYEIAQLGGRTLSAIEAFFTWQRSAGARARTRGSHRHDRARR
jgi:guanine deaminase